MKHSPQSTGKPAAAPNADRTAHASAAQEPATATTELLRRAGADPAERLPASLSGALSQRVAADFSGVRVHRGAASHEAAERIGARAYTLGDHVHLNNAAGNLSVAERDRLLAHEAVHSAQQGGGTVAPHAGLHVGAARDASEAEAERIAGELSASPSLALRDRLRAAPLSQRHGPLIQRDLKGPYKSTDGDFDLNLKTESHPGAKSGMSGTIQFTPAAKAPDSKSIRLLQVVKTTVGTTGKDYMWTGNEANRNKIMTSADKPSGVEAGFFVDALHKNRTPRTAKADAPVSPYYIDDYKANKDPNNRDGSKQGSTIKSASLWDYPGDSAEGDFKFETAAKAADTGYVYATLTWGFTISDGAKGKVTGEYANAHYVQSSTFNAALKKFDEFYKNPGAATAPSK